MRRLVIKNFGPVASAELDLKKFNVIVGPQSSGKSCVLKVASFCVWAEKRIQLSQAPEFIIDADFINSHLLEFHKLASYVSESSYIEFENDSLRFSYSWAEKKVEFEWKKSRWKYKSSKVSYIPSERNMVSAIPNWFEINLEKNNVRHFMSDWDVARKSDLAGLPILNLGVRYKYEVTSDSDMVELAGGKVVKFSDVSSGLQSVIPIFVHLNYLYKKRFDAAEKKSIKSELEESRLWDTMRRSSVENMEQVHQNFCERGRNDVFLEEPEQNLFPPTQSLLVNSLVTQNNGKRGGMMFVATHSPYVVTSLLEKNLRSFSLFLSLRQDDGNYVVKVASPADIQAIYDYGMDVFFNIESFAE